jgi:hypothetical protein
MHLAGVAVAITERALTVIVRRNGTVPAVCVRSSSVATKQTQIFNSNDSISL